ncbi:MAG: Phosphocarrier protein HPr [Chlamydiae bacterium]|nr:Phosphocarrier protein HPr [Chlamydiota bacterium]
MEDMFYTQEEKHEGSFEIANDKGLHTRPSAELAKLAMTFSSNISLILDNQKVNAKSLLEILTLSATKGSVIKIEAVGKDSKQVIDELCQLACKNFKMAY